MSDFLKIKTDFLNDLKIIKMMSDYGFLGVGYYILILTELQKNDGVLGFDDLYTIEAKSEIKHKKLRNFVLNCIEQYTVNDIGIFSSNETSFWLSESKAPKKKQLKANTTEEKPLVSTFLRLPNEKCLTRLTPQDVAKLNAKWGEDLALACIIHFDNWLVSCKSGLAKKARKSNDHYDFFRSNNWVEKGGREILEKRAKENKYNFGI